jgi:phenol 2-monooxygenase
MEIHLNGFHDGNPDMKTPAPKAQQYTPEMPSELDVLIVGSGPAGLTLAAQLANIPEIRTRVVERKDGPMLRGQADGVSCRSMEMFAAFGFDDRAMKEGHWVNETCFWSPDPENPQRITRVGRVQDVADDLSEMPHIILNQGRVHDFYLDIMRQSPTRLEVDYQHQLSGLTIDPSAADYPVTVTLDHQGQSKTVRANYVVGCDGARSAVRTAIGRELKGDYAYQAWGVMDVLMVTDFPDIRHKNIIKSAHEGNVLIIPREGGHLVRMYVELDKLQERGESKAVNLERIIETAGKIFHPYQIEVKDVAWWSVYEIGHSVTDKFDDVPSEAMPDRLPHVFIAGDACHTHSAKAGRVYGRHL